MFNKDRLLKGAVDILLICGSIASFESRARMVSKLYSHKTLYQAFCALGD